MVEVNIVGTVAALGAAVGVEVGLGGMRVGSAVATVDVDAAAVAVGPALDDGTAPARPGAHAPITSISAMSAPVRTLLGIFASEDPSAARGGSVRPGHHCSAKGGRTGSSPTPRPLYLLST